jgi:GxxExxY protein
VHRTLGPGQAVYSQCLCYELHQDGLAFEREVPLPIIYETMRTEKGYTVV